MLEKTAILGLGLMGGSLGLALKSRGLAKAVAGYSRNPESRRAALERGAADFVHDRPESAVMGADMVVACAPVLSLPDLVARCAAGLDRNAVVTDVGSAKAWVVPRIEKTVAGVCLGFVGSHPIAGGERRGIGAARADLFENAAVVVTPTPSTAPAAIARVRAFWGALGARVLETSPEEHDRILARTSHLPHLAAAALAKCVGREAPEQTAAFCGAGFADTTRIADGGEDLWRDIVSANSAAIAAELAQYKKQIEELMGIVEAADSAQLLEFLAQSRQTRKKLVAGGGDER